MISFKNLIDNGFLLYKLVRQLEGLEWDWHMQFDGLEDLGVHTLGHALAAADEDDAIVFEEVFFEKYLVFFYEMLHISLLCRVLSAFGQADFDHPLLLVLLPLFHKIVVNLPVLDSKISRHKRLLTGRVLIFLHWVA